MDNNGVLGNLMNNTYGQDLIRNIIGTMYTPEQISAFKPADMADISKRVGDFMSDPKWTQNNPMQMRQGQGQMAGLPAPTPEELLELHQPLRMPQSDLLTQYGWVPSPEELQEASQHIPMRMRPAQPQQQPQQRRPKDAVTGGVIRQGKMTPTTYESYR